MQSLSGDDERSGDSGVDRGGVSSGSVPAKAASTRLTISLDASIDDLLVKEGQTRKMLDVELTAVNRVNYDHVVDLF